jgi:DNA-binding transcriptional LysR family regulator
VADLRRLGETVGEGGTTLSLALADSIAASWGPAVVAGVLETRADLRVELHAHRGVLVIESVRLGRYHVGMTTESRGISDLVIYPVAREPLVVVHSGLGQSATPHGPLITIEPSSGTWQAIEPQLRQKRPQLLQRPIVPVESFSAALQMVKAGFGDGLVPLGLVIEAQLDGSAYTRLAGVARNITLITRKTIDQLAAFGHLREGLTSATQRYFRSRPALGETKP